MTAAELALGVLEGDERAAALRRSLADRGFAAEVKRWRARFDELHADWTAEPPPSGGLARLEAALDDSAQTDFARAASRWRFAALAASLVAAILLAFLVVRPPTDEGQSPARTHAALLLAILQPAAGSEPIAAAYDAASNRLSVAPATLAGADKSAEVWVIAAGAKPRSLGLLAPGRTTRIAVPGNLAPLLTQRAQLAISVEPLGGSPTGQPTGPVVASGQFS
jgi:anti-sigma-K factor RskA